MDVGFLKDEQHGPHGKSRIHAANCYMGPLSHNAFSAVARAQAIREEVGTQFGHHSEFGNSVIQGNSRIAIANLLGTDVRNVALTVNTNDSLHIIRNGLGLGRSHNVALYAAEYLDVKTPFIRRADLTHGCNPIYIRGARDQHNRPLGFDLKDFETTIRVYPISLVVVTHVQFTSGFTTDLAALSLICKERGVPLVVDAAQSFGVFQIRPDELGISALAAPLWKWIGGYRGTAFLWTSEEFRQSLDIERLSASGMKVDNWLTDVSTAPLNADATKFETSTLPTESWIPTSVMLAESVRQETKNIETEIRRLQALARDILSNHSKLEICKTPSGEESSGSFLAIYLKDPYVGRENEIVERLQVDSMIPIDVTARGGFIRLAFHKFSSDRAVTYVCERLRQEAQNL